VGWTSQVTTIPSPSALLGYGGVDLGGGGMDLGGGGVDLGGRGVDLVGVVAVCDGVGGVDLGGAAAVEWAEMK